MKKIMILICIFAYSNTIFAEYTNSAATADVLPANAKNKKETVPLELEIKRIQSFIDANKPVAAGTYLPYAEHELARIKIYLTERDVLEFKHRLEDMKNTIEIQKDFQKKKYGKLLEMN